ncbi:uncharacterized mitochondrial protein AtMg00810-like [Lactuca sativa]|uniref:uncharacterized mitochondrial protein AtMg00810-like n=1 Tax=Lactuca sativa TaxID=4236 RepID=UPI001C693D35|nr:uncharacterized mitochondrial protein AtMg00810-like [Lactuca sativa]
MAYILLYVDDIIFTASSDDLRLSIMGFLSSEFPMKDLGPLNYFHGISVSRHKEGMFLSQHKYADKIIEGASMSSCKPSHTPVDTKQKLLDLLQLPDFEASIGNQPITDTAYAAVANSFLSPAQIARLAPEKRVLS